MIGAATLFWYAVLWSVGVDVLVGARGIRHDRLTEVIFHIWNSQPIGAHGFAGALSLDAFAHRQVYTGHPPALLVMWYVIATISSALFGERLGYATNLIPFVQGALLSASFGWLAWSSSYTRGRWSLHRSALLVLGLGFLLTARPLWTGFFMVQPDNPYPVVACLLLPMIPFVVEGLEQSRRAALVAVFAFALAGPIYTPVVLGTLFVLLRARGIDSRLRRVLITAAGAALLIAVAGVIGPRLVATALGNTTDNSTWLFRSGLDGDRQYLDTVFAAIVDPFVNHGSAIQGYEPRRGLELAGMPAIVFLVAAALACGRRESRASSLTWMAGAGVLLLAPYLFTVVFFAQALTIHPYLYDYLLQFPLAAVGVATMLHVARDTESLGAVALAFGWLLTAGIMSNLIGLAQGVRVAVH